MKMRLARAILLLVASVAVSSCGQHSTNSATPQVARISAKLPALKRATLQSTSRPSNGFAVTLGNGQQFYFTGDTRMDLRPDYTAFKVWGTASEFQTKAVERIVMIRNGQENIIMVKDCRRSGAQPYRCAANGRF